MEKRLSQLAIVLTIVGLLVSLYMTIFKITNNSSTCVESHSCVTVNNSRYAQINGIPAAVLLEPRVGFLQQNGSLVVFGLSLIGFLLTLYLIYVEVALIKADCLFCITSQSAMTLIFLLSVIRVVQQP